MQIIGIISHIINDNTPVSTWKILSGQCDIRKPYLRVFKASAEFIAKFKSKLHFMNLIHHFQFDMETIQEHLTMDNSTLISMYQTKLTEEFIDQNADILDWYELCRSQHFSEDFMRKHIDNVHWKHILEYQKPSQGFIDEFKNHFVKNTN